MCEYHEGLRHDPLFKTTPYLYPCVQVYLISSVYQIKEAFQGLEEYLFSLFIGFS
jgi:hypothetical protein